MRWFSWCDDFVWVNVWQSLYFMWFRWCDVESWLCRSGHDDMREYIVMLRVVDVWGATRAGNYWSAMGLWAWNYWCCRQWVTQSHGLLCVHQTKESIFNALIKQIYVLYLLKNFVTDQFSNTERFQYQSCNKIVIHVSLKLYWKDSQK